MTAKLSCRRQTRRQLGGLGRPGAMQIRQKPGIKQLRHFRQGTGDILILQSYNFV